MLLAIILGGSGGLGAVLAAGAASRGAASIFIYLFLLLTDSAAGGITVGRGCPANQERKEH